MALRVPQMPSLIKDGYSHMKGLDEAVYRNIDAAKELALLVRSSLGPNGHAKMIINHLDKIFVTSDTSTILNEFEVVHPAAKLLVMASQMMQLEVGDATNEVVILAGRY